MIFFLLFSFGFRWSCKELEATLAAAEMADAAERCRATPYSTATLPPSPGAAAEAQPLTVKSPGRPQAARTVPLNGKPFFLNLLKKLIQCLAFFTAFLLNSVRLGYVRLY